MADDTQTRKLATIVALDVAGYSARTEADEARTTAEVAALRKVIETIAAKHGGRVFNTAGDGFMLEFGSSLAAVEAAFELAETCDPKVRVGVHVGDVVPQPNGDLLGHGVNIAARLMAKAEPGSSLVSADVRRMIRGPIADRLQSRGLLKLDKMAETIEAFVLAAAMSGKAATAATAPVEPLLAVLPFDNLSADPEMQFFSDGVAEEIMQTLMRSAGLKVIGRTSAFQFRGERKSLAAQALKATHILDGNVRRSGARMRVSAQLTDAGTGTALWGERYDREVSDAFALQDEIAGQVATALNRKLSTARADAEGMDPLAYDLFMKAQPALTANDMTIAMGAIPLFETVVSRAPRFATGWGALAFARAASMSKSLDAEHDVNYRATVEANNRSIELDSASTLSLLTQTALLPAFSSHARKIALCEEALKTEPNNSLVLQMLADAYFNVGHMRKALDIATKVVEIDPMSGPGYVAISEVLRQCGRQQEALVALQVENEASVRGRWWVPRSQWNFPYFDDDLDGADAFLAENESRFADAPKAVLPALRSATRILRMPINERRASMRHILAAERDRPVSLESCGFAARAGCADEAYEALFAALESGKPIVGAIVNANAGSLRTFACGQLFGEISGRLRQDLRFPRLCAAIGLVDYWHESGHWPDCVDEVTTYYDFKAECEKAAREASRR